MKKREIKAFGFTTDFQVADGSDSTRSHIGTILKERFRL